MVTHADPHPHRVISQLGDFLSDGGDRGDYLEAGSNVTLAALFFVLLFSTPSVPTVPMGYSIRLDVVSPRAGLVDGAACCYYHTKLRTSTLF